MSADIILFEKVVDYDNDIEDNLFSPHNSREMCKKVLVSYYDTICSTAKVIPSLDDIIDHVSEYNDEITYDLTIRELRDECRNCEKAYSCWKDGDIFGDLINEDEYCDCEASCMEIIDDSVTYNFATYANDELIISLLQEIGYPVIISSHHLSLFYNDVPFTYVNKMDIVFNDAQLKILPQMDSKWELKEEFRNANLMLTG